MSREEDKYSVMCTSKIEAHDRLVLINLCKKNHAGAYYGTAP